jgi:hypothetical protein
MIKRLISLISFALLVVFVFANCAGHSEDIPLEASKSPHYTVLADEHLQERHKVAILKALSDWTTKTNNTLTYDLQYVDMSQYPVDDYIPKTIRIYVHDPGPGYLGWTSWESNMGSTVFVEPSIDGELFRRIMMHEFGHAFDLHFDKGDVHYNGPYQSVMHPGLYDDALEVSCPEITAFCNNYGCQVDCTNIPIPTPTHAPVGSIWKTPSEVIVR